MIGAFATAAVVAIALAGGGFGGGALGIATAAVWLAIVVLVLAGGLPLRQPRPGLVAAAGCLLALLALTILSTSWTNSDEGAFEAAVRIAGYLGVFLLAGIVARRDRIGAALTGLALGGVLVAIVALASRLLGIGAGDADLVAQLPTAAGRLSFPVGYWNALGALMALSLPPLCWRAAQDGSPRRAGLALAGFPPLIAAGYLTSSRGAVLAMLIGLAVTVGCSIDRRRAAAAATIGLAVSAPVVIAATLASGLIDSPGSGSPGRPELVTLAALLAGSCFALLLGGRLIAPLSASRPFTVNLSVRGVVAASVVAAAVVVVAIGPSALIGDLRSGTDAQTSTDDRATGIISASGSGRAQFWGAALDAFADEPVLGIGAGGFPAYWDRYGTLSTPARNAHSEPLEVLAELGTVGFLCFAAFIFVLLLCATGRVRRAEPESDGEGPAGAMGLIAAGLLSFAIDWTWQVPAVVVPVMVAGGMTCALAAPSKALARVPRVSPRAVAVGSIALAVPAIWAAGVLALTTTRLDDSADALAAGRLNEAAAAARSAASIQPWAAAPWLQLAVVEQAAGNYDASMAAAAEAIDRDSSSVDAWVLATTLQVQMGDEKAAAAYTLRTLELSYADPLPSAEGG